MNIFEIQQSKTDKEFIIKNGSLEFEVFADIVEKTADALYLGSLFKLGKVAINYMDYRFVKKLHYFLAELEDIEQEKKDKFLSGLTPDDSKRISSYLTQLLYSSEEDAKAALMGKIYKSRLMDEIDNDMMLRLCSVVNKSFLADLDHLKEYETENASDDYIGDNLNALGLLQDLGTLHEEEHDGWYSSGIGSSKHQLNIIGRELLRIKER